MIGSLMAGLQKTTNYRVVLPFYAYAALSFVLSAFLLLLNTDLSDAHYFYPTTLAITHIMTLGWGTMIIFGASHQLLPVLVEGKLDNELLAYTAFGFMASGIPILIYSFYTFNTGWWMISGAGLINLGVICYLINVLLSSFKSQKRNVHAWFIIAAGLWLMSTTVFGLLLVLNFNFPVFSAESLHYLSIHAHMGLAGWFLLLVMGVGSRLIPMFLISKYTNNRTLWVIFSIINAGLILFLISEYFELNLTYLTLALFLIAIILFGRHCYRAYKVRIRKNVDEQMKTSLISVVQMVLPIIVLLCILLVLPSNQSPRLVILYGFCILFGWITAIIFGMTFKTLPFIVWNKVYQKKAHSGKSPAPKELFSESIYHLMLIAYLIGFVLFVIGIISITNIIIKVGSVALLISAILYLINVIKTLLHKPAIQ
ncbi:MAG: hypothetical protein J5I59_03685 [Saprospiraceae bacterium]|nr:hypothetical protein [Saprospiraceae bacterium]